MQCDRRRGYYLANGPGAVTADAGTATADDNPSSTNANPATTNDDQLVIG